VAESVSTPSPLPNNRQETATPPVAAKKQTIVDSKRQISNDDEKY